MDLQSLATIGLQVALAKFPGWVTPVEQYTEQHPLVVSALQETAALAQASGVPGVTQAGLVTSYILAGITSLVAQTHTTTAPASSVALPSVT